jgi:NDP-sugar pyrophosphorylase family protein
MRAMVLAAGLGTRLRPLTDNQPKALVELCGHTLLEIALRRLHAAGVREVVVNAHYRAEMIADYIAAHSDFDTHVEVLHETDLLDTGGGLKNASAFFLRSTHYPDEPFILHNVDVISTIDLYQMIRFHREQNALATLAVQHRPSTRSLLFDDNGKLCGRASSSGGNTELTIDGRQPLAFSGIHLISPVIFSLLTEHGAFSIIDAYVRLAAQGEKIVAYRDDQSYWRDLGRPQDIEQAEQDIRTGRYPIS